MQALLNVFISHRHDDAIAATKVRETIDRYSANQIRVFVSSSDIPPGEEWLNWIRKRLTESNLLLLLFTDTAKVWDWCLYEAGMFTGLEGDHYKKVICIHDSNLQPPKPLQHLQAVPATVDGLTKFLRELFCETALTRLDNPISPGLCKQEEQILNSAQELNRVFNSKPAQEIYFGEYLSLHIDVPSAITEEAIPDNAKVDGSARCLEMFGKRPLAPNGGRWNWHDLEQEARKNRDQRWIEELTKAIYMASHGDLFDPIQATFCARRGGNTYRPILSSANFGSDGAIAFKVLFEEDVSWRLDDIPQHVAVLLTAQTMAIRFRYELLRKFVSRLEEVRSGEGDDFYNELKHLVESIEEEARSRGLFDKDMLLAAFGDDGHIVGEMFEAWYVLKKDLLQTCDKHDLKGLRRSLEDLLEINTKFIPLAAKNYERVVNTTLASEEVYSH
jgi:hypothetical protein